MTTLAAIIALGFIFGLALGDGLPLHVGGIVRAAAGERNDVVNHKSRTRPAPLVGCRARMRSNEITLRPGAAMADGQERRREAYGGQQEKRQKDFHK